ncbi:related to Cupin domain protein [Phialocephala subalpina]|uniref:Related to Cupin domain protein n=1 Tax=Phialocephala subalpina TaxID=576137 RepID=A0A1L7X9Z1_9HELO|nr:related to Cupin domain protein [Phialocephala subalpina]
MASSSSSPPSVLENGLPNVSRYITTTNSSGQAVLSSVVASPSVWQSIGNIAKFFLAYTTRTFPVKLSRAESSQPAPDITSYAHDLSSPPGLGISTGTVMRYVDMAPGSISPMHITKTLDYGTVIEGEIELVLDSGEKKVLRRGDSCVQRGTMHAWRNVSEREWGRMVFVLVGAEGEGVKEELGDMPEGVRGSD